MEATVCAIAVWILADGWKNTLMTVTPDSDCDSMCSMSLTVVVNPRSVCDALPHFLSRQAVVIPYDADHRNIDFWENIGCHVAERKRRHEHDEHRHHNECVWSAKCKFDHRQGSELIEGKLLY